MLPSGREPLCVLSREECSPSQHCSHVVSLQGRQYGRDDAEGNEDDEENDLDNVGVDGRHDRGAGACQLQLNKFDFYRHRPEELEHCTLAQFVRYIILGLLSSKVLLVAALSSCACTFLSDAKP